MEIEAYGQTFNGPLHEIEDALDQIENHIRYAEKQRARRKRKRSICQLVKRFLKSRRDRGT